MSRVLTIWLMVMVAWHASGQNIVPNSNFRNYSFCPVRAGDINFCQEWTTPTNSTPDYMHECSNLPGGNESGVPDNFVGSQSSTSGAYLGLVNLAVVDPNSAERDYATTQLPVMEIGGIYRVSMVVSLADIHKYATMAPSVYFSTFPIPYTTTRHKLPYEAQVLFEDDGIISDKVHWVTVSDTFVADSAYMYLTIGNFKDSAATTKVLLTDGSYYPAAYYYIDSVAVEKIGVSGVGDVRAGLDVFVAPNPAHGMVAVHVGGDAARDYTMEIRSVTGSVARSRVLHGGGAHDVDISELAPGMYMYTLRDGAGNAGYGKLMVE